MISPALDIAASAAAVEWIPGHPDSQQALRRAYRALKTLSAGRSIVGRASSEQELLDKLCRLPVDVGGYAKAWMGFWHSDGTPIPPRSAVARQQRLHLCGTGEAGSVTEAGRDAIERCLRSGVLQRAHDLEAGPARGLGTTSGHGYRCRYASLIALPLADRSGLAGVLAIYASESCAFDAEETAHLSALAAEVVDGIATQRARADQCKAGARTAMLARMPEENPNAVMRLDEHGTLIYANPASAKFLLACDGRVGDPAPPACRAAARAAIESGSAKSEALLLGDKVYEATFVPVAGENHVTIYAVDITARRAAEASLRAALVNTVEAIAATVQMRDSYTAGHQRRVAELAAAIAREMGLSPDAVEGIRFGALIHDVGKVKIPADLLTRPARLSALEFELVKIHAQAGYDIVKGLSFPWPVADMVLQHHERLDGSGYPQGLMGDAIVIGARILAVADVVEAMSSHRPYRSALGVPAALQEIAARRGTLYDPGAVDACIRVFLNNGFQFEAPPVVRGIFGKTGC